MAGAVAPGQGLPVLFVRHAQSTNNPLYEGAYHVPRRTHRFGTASQTAAFISALGSDTFRDQDCTPHSDSHSAESACDYELV